MDESWSHKAGEADRWHRLTERQRACIDRVLDRKSSKQIARELGISKDTVDQRIAAARRILGAADRNELARSYARLKSLYDRDVYDPALIGIPPVDVPTRYPDGDPEPMITLDASAVQARSAKIAKGLSGEFWRHDHGVQNRLIIVTVMLVAAVILILAGLAIGEALTRLLSL